MGSAAGVECRAREWMGVGWVCGRSVQDEMFDALFFFIVHLVWLTVCNIVCVVCCYGHFSIQWLHNGLDQVIQSVSLWPELSSTIHLRATAQQSHQQSLLQIADHHCHNQKQR